MTNTILAFCFGVIFAAALVAFFPGKNFEDMQKVIKDCEASLPRDQHCVVRAEPVSKENK